MVKPVALSSKNTLTVEMSSKADPVGIEVNGNSSSSTLPNSDENGVISYLLNLH